MHTMATTYASIPPDIEKWIAAQRLFFVATAPLGGDGLINCSPKGTDSFRVLGPNQVAYADLTGSGIETVAHLKENGRIVIMFCAFNGPPKIVRLWGRGSVVERDHAEFGELEARFARHAATRALIRVDVARVATSCGFGVPIYEYVSDRDTLIRYADEKGPQGVAEYRRQKNATSLDGLPGLRSF
jgi:hypothetical protein